MICAYDKVYLESAKRVLGRMLDFAVYDLQYSIEDFFSLFIKLLSLWLNFPRIPLSFDFRYSNAPDCITLKKSREIKFKLWKKNKAVKPFFSVSFQRELE